ncbi:MinD/ParA family ATP-binding protein [Robiginitomaculum antarcticum]|uniref:MinD/ParA family ATP-binding protein n=1 Tax=Robiginitomaculum antarcticum TaxID=437507 RepID=UPI00036E515A|nr:hypothetical protein [Robiginitomaculum antarcticum]
MPHNVKRETRARLFCIMAAEDGLPSANSARALAHAARRRGDSVLLVDCADSINSEPATLSDVLRGEAQLCDAKQICPHSGLIEVQAGDAPLYDILGILAALSLTYDNVIVTTPFGCTPAIVRLATAADVSLLHYHSQSDRFMRGYWMLDALRTRCPRLDPLLIACGPEDEAREAHKMLTDTIREFLGAPPPLAAIITRDGMTSDAADGLLDHLDIAEPARRSA